MQSNPQDPQQTDLEKVIPKEIFDQLKKIGITQLYPPQIKAIMEGLKEENLFVSIPTAAGKTLIAIVLIMNHFLNYKDKRSTHKMIYLTPLKALAREKYQEFTQNWGDLGIKIKKAVSDPDKDESYVFNADLIIMTNEKADSMLRGKPELMQSVSLIVVDEIHLMNDQSRGATLEMLLTRIKAEQPNAQIIGLSATVSNYLQLSKWLDANTIKDEWRPISVRYMYYIPNELHELKRTDDNQIEDRIFKRVTPVAAIDPAKKPDKSDLLNSMVELTLDIMDTGGQCLIFTNSRKNAMDYARKIGEYVATKLDADLIKELDQMATEFLNLTPELTELSKKEAECIRKGVVFHHAGLVEEQQRKIEDAFKKRKIKAIVATPTLAAGVNVPARRVIIQSTTRFDEASGRSVAIPIMEFQQMAGRAGRPGYDPYGEVVVLSNNYDIIRTTSEKYYFSPPEKVISKLADKSQFETQLLGAIASKIAKNHAQLFNYLKNSFYFYQNLDGETKYEINSIENVRFPKTKKKVKTPNIERARDEIKKRKELLAKRNIGRGRDPLNRYDDFIQASELVDEEKEEENEETEEIIEREGESEEQSESQISPSELKELETDLKRAILNRIENLEKNKLIERDGKELKPTDLGKIAFEMYVKPETAIILLDYLTKAKKYHDNDELEYHVSTWLYIMSLTGEYRNTSPSKNVMNYIILNYDKYSKFLPIAEIPDEISDQFQEFATNLKAVMALEDWMNEVPEAQISDRYEIQGGDLNYIINIACWLSRCLYRFSAALGLNEITSLLKDFEKRLKSGIKEELLPLINIKGIGRRRARALFNAGIKTQEDILNTPAAQLKQIPGFSDKLIQKIREEIEIKKRGSKTKKTSVKKQTIKDHSNRNEISEEDLLLFEPDDDESIGRDISIEENQSNTEQALKIEETIEPEQTQHIKQIPKLEQTIEPEQTQHIKQTPKLEQTIEAEHGQKSEQSSKIDKTISNEANVKEAKKGKKTGSLLDFF
jgi:helicase